MTHNGIKERTLFFLSTILLLGTTFATEDQSEPTPPVAATVGAFGSEQPVGNDFVSTFYDFSRDRRGRDLPISSDSYKEKLLDFFNSGWKTSKLTRYYLSPKKLYTSTIMVSALRPSSVPVAFAEPDAWWCWAVLYKGKLVHKDAITFRFWGVGDDIMLVRVGGKIVLSACSGSGSSSPAAFFSSLWKSSSPDTGEYYLGNNTSTAGDWITLEPGVPLDMEVMTGNMISGPFSAMLLVEVQGVEYEKNRQGGPVLPVFKTANLSHDMQDAICKGLVSGEASVTNGPVFCDSDASQNPAVVEDLAEPSIPVMGGNSIGSKMRLWTGGSGKILEAKFVKLVGGQILLEDSNGAKRKIPLDRFSQEDQNYVELAHVLKLDIDFTCESRKQDEPDDSFSSRDWRKESNNLPDFFDHAFTVELKQASSKVCTRELSVEFYVIADEREGDKHLLLDRQEGRFSPNKSYSHAFTTKSIPIFTDDMYKNARDEESFGYLVVLSDEQGMIVQHSTSDEWLFNNIENLRRVSVGAYIDKTCTRVLPSGPSPTKY